MCLEFDRARSFWFLIDLSASVVEAIHSWILRSLCLRVRCLVCVADLLSLNSLSCDLIVMLETVTCPGDPALNNDS